MVVAVVIRAFDPLPRHRLLLSCPSSLPPSPSANPNAVSGLPSPRRASPPHRIRGPGLCPCRRDWDSNAETVRSSRFRSRGGGGVKEEEDDGFFWKRGKRKWWSDDSYDELDEEDSELFDDVVEQPWDKIWIFKVFKSYGYLLPAIIASLLLSTGPKAFLLALALPLGQSALSLAIEKLWGNAREEPRPRSKTKRKPFVGSTSGFKRQEEEQSAGTSQGYQSWMAADVGVSDKENDVHNNSFGGWDELDRRREPISQQRPPRTTTRPARAQPTKKGKLSRRGRNRDMPFFLRLLVAVFPFLGSWTRIL